MLPSHVRWQTCVPSDSTWTSWRQKGDQSHAAARKPATKRKKSEFFFRHLFLSSERTITPADDYFQITCAVVIITEQSKVSVQLVPQSQTISHARASSSRMWPRWRQKKKGLARNKPSFSACTRKASKSWIIAAWEQKRRKMSNQAANAIHTSDTYGIYTSTYTSKAAN